MKIDIPKISPYLTTKNFSDIYDEEEPALEMCLITDSDFTDEAVDRVRLNNAVIK